MPRTAIWVDDATYLEPDLMYISDALRKRMPAKHWYTADLVVEISSPSTRIYDRKTKADTYRAMHVREMWLVYPDTKAVEVRYFESDRSATFKGDETIQPEVLPGIDLPVKRIFEETS